MNVPIYCHACTGRFSVQAAKVTADLTCTSCGSPDIDLDQSPEAPHTAAHTPVAASDRTADSAASGSPQNSKTASQALCTNCFRDKYDYEPNMGDEGSSFSQGTCSVCGNDQGTVFTPSDDLLSATSAKKTADFNDPEMGQVKEVAEVTQKVTCSSCLTEHTVDAVDPAQPLPVCPSCGKDTLSVAGGTVASRKTAKVANNPKMSNPDYAAGYLSGSQDAARGEKFDLQNYYESSNSDFAEGYYAGFDDWTTPGVPPHMLASRKTATFYCTTCDVYVGDGNRDTHAKGSCNVEQRKAKESSRRTADADFKPGSPCPHCGGSVELTAKAGSPLTGADRYKCSGCMATFTDAGSTTASLDAAFASLLPSTEMDQAFIAARREAKVAEIVAGIRATNPSLSPSEARRVAENTVNRFPQIVS